MLLVSLSSIFITILVKYLLSPMESLFTATLEVNSDTVVVSVVNQSVGLTSRLKKFKSFQNPIYKCDMLILNFVITD